MIIDKNSTALPVALLFLTAIVWSSSGVLIKIVDWPPLAIAGWRSLVAAFFLLVVCRRQIKVSFGPDEILAAMCMTFFCICFVAATKLTTAANAIVLQYAAPVIVAVAAPRLLGEPTQRRDWFFMALVLGGIALFFMDSMSLQGVWGIALAILASVFWAGMALFVRKSKGNSTAWSLSLGHFATALICLPWMFEVSARPIDWLGVVLAGLISLGLGYALFSYCITRVTALESILIPAIEPLFNPLWVFLATGELPGPWGVLGGAVVLLSVTARGLLSVRESRALNKMPPPASAPA